MPSTIKWPFSAAPRSTYRRGPCIPIILACSWRPISLPFPRNARIHCCARRRLSPILKGPSLRRISYYYYSSHRACCTGRTEMGSAFSVFQGSHTVAKTPLEPRADGILRLRYFQSRVTGLWLFHRTWQAVGNVRGAVYISHGFGEHCGRYEGVASVLTQAGFVVHALDHQGHGQSEGDRSFFASLDHVVSDVIQLVEHVAPHTDVPTFILGHSMGGLIATLVLERAAHLFTGAVLSGPAFAIVDPKTDTPTNRYVVGLLSSCIPKLPLVPVVAEGLSHDAEIVAQYRRDPLNHHGGPHVRVAHEMLQGADRALAGAPGVTLPVLIVHGADDQICRVAGSRALLARLGSADKRLVEYPGLLHEIFNELQRARVLEDVVQWLQRHADA